MHRNLGTIQTRVAMLVMLGALTSAPLRAVAEPKATEKPVTMTEAQKEAADPTRSPQLKESAAMEAQYSESNGGRAEYIVISPHTAAECAAALEQAETQGSLAKFGWGCKQGDHTGYAVVQAANSEEALKLVPANVREKARAIRLDRFTAAEIQAMHSGTAH